MEKESSNDRPTPLETPKKTEMETENIENPTMEIEKPENEQKENGSQQEAANSKEPEPVRLSEEVPSPFDSKRPKLLSFEFPTNLE